MSTFYLKVGDTSPILTQTLRNSAGEAINLASATVLIRVISVYGATVLTASATIDDATAGEISYEFAGDLAVGTYRYEFEVTYSDSAVETFPNVGYNDLIVGP
jgi:hypothetical protein